MDRCPPTCRFQSKSETLGRSVLSLSPFLFERDSMRRCIKVHAKTRPGHSAFWRQYQIAGVALQGPDLVCPMPGSDQKRSQKGRSGGHIRTWPVKVLQFMPTKGCLVSSFVTLSTPFVILNGWRWRWQHGPACGSMVPVNLAPLNNIIGSSRRGLDPAGPAPCTCSGCSQGPQFTPRPPHTVEFKSTGPPRAHCAVPLPRPCSIASLRDCLPTRSHHHRAPRANILSTESPWPTHRQQRPPPPRARHGPQPQRRLRVPRALQPPVPQPAALLLRQLPSTSEFWKRMWVIPE